LPEIGLAPAPPRELGEQVRESAHVLEALDHFLDAVEVAADADVVDARGLSDVLDVIGHIGELPHRCGVGTLPGLALAADRRSVATESALRVSQGGGAAVSVLLRRLVGEGR